jgi:hypothetical protein
MKYMIQCGNPNEGECLVFALLKGGRRVSLEEACQVLPLMAPCSTAVLDPSRHDMQEC